MVTPTLDPLLARVARQPVVRSTGRVLVVNQHHSDADDLGPASAERPLRSISAAARLAQPGDTVLVHAGVYRERVAPERGGTPELPITYTAAPGERVVIRGSEPWSPGWREVDRNTVVAPLEGLSHDAALLYTTRIERARGCRTLGQVFLDDIPLDELEDPAAVKCRSGSWCVTEDGRHLWLHAAESPVPLSKRRIELTVRGRLFAPRVRGLGYIVVSGFIFEHCGNAFPHSFWESQTPQAGAVSCRGGHHWIIERNTIRHAKAIGLDCGSEGRYDADGRDQPEPDDSGHHLIRYNTISDNGACGIAGYRSPGTRILHNVLERNNCIGFTAPETGAIKLHFFVDGLIEGNLIRDNDTTGIWLDNVWHGSRVARNVLISNQGAGIFVELGNGPLLVDNNVIAFTRATTALAGDGLYSHDASGVTFAHNLLLFNGNFGVWVHVATDRPVRFHDERRPAEASDWRIVNNMILGNPRGAISLPPPTSRSKRNESNYNLLSSGYDLLTSETYATPLHAPLFVVNTNKDRVQSVGDGLFNSLLSLEQWQASAGHDRHSLVPRFMRPMLSTRSLWLEFMIDSAPRRVQCERIPGIDSDLFGCPLPREPMCGPFQNLRFERELEVPAIPTEHRGPYERIPNSRDRMNVLRLWPLAKLDDGETS